MAGRAVPLETLVVRSGTGDTAAFADLYDRLAPRVFAMVARLVRDPRADERISCDAFLEVWRRAATYDPATSDAAAWVLAVARRIALLAVGLTPAQTDAVQLAWCDGLDHRSIEAELRSDQPATALLTGALRALTPAGGR